MYDILKELVNMAQWENICISPSVLPMVRVMIDQWGNECISLRPLSVTWVQFPEYFEGFSAD